MPTKNHDAQIIDTNPHFKIDGTTRAVTNESEVKIAIMQTDHNSQRFTFEIPRYIDSHDMSTCNLVQIHYLNGSNPGVYDVDDLKVDPENSEIITCSWLLSSNATETVGSLNFALRFACVTDDNEYDYVWNTAVFSGISVSASIYNTPQVVDKYIDVLEQWKDDLFNSVPKATVARIDNGARITITGTNGSTEATIHDGTKMTIEQQNDGVNITTVDYTGTNTVFIKNGKDGVSPVVSLEEQTDGVNITIQNGQEQQTVKVLHGETGPQGATGPKGDPGEKGEQGIQGPKGDPGADATDEQVQTSVNTYMEENQLQLMMLDKSLTEADHAADSKAVGDKFAEMNKYLAQIYEEQYSFGFVEHMDILSPSNRIEYLCLNKYYTAMTINMTNHTTNYGSWSTFPSIVENKPYMVKPTGEADYQLDENDYTLKTDGSASDVANTDYEGGAFSKFIKVYVKRWIDGNDRHVRFSYVPIEGYEPCGFIDTDGSEMEYVWLPMFYGSTIDGKMRSLSGLQPDINQNTATQYTNNTAFSDRAAFFAGPIIETIRDMLYMLFKTTELQGACGKGNCSGYVNNPEQNYGILPNSVIGGGQFYGTTDGKSLNKIFHSIVIGSYQQYQRDPYYLVVNGRFKVSVDYTYDVTGESYIDTGIDSETADSNKWLYPNVSTVVDKFGSIPIAPFGGSTRTGYCDGVYHPLNNEFTAVVLRFGYCSSGSNAGLACLYLAAGAGLSRLDISASVLLRPPVTA